MPDSVILYYDSRCWYNTVSVEKYIKKSTKSQPLVTFRDAHNTDAGTLSPFSVN